MEMYYTIHLNKKCLKPAQFSEHLSSAVSGRSLDQPFNLIIYVESAIGLLNLADVCSRGTWLQQQGALFSLQGVVFGSDDFVADIGTLLTRARNPSEKT